MVRTSPRLRSVGEHDLRGDGGVELALWPETIPPFAYGLTPHPWRSMSQPLRLRDAERPAANPRAIINCNSTLTGTPHATRHRWLDGDPVLEIESGRDLMVTEPRQLVDMLLVLA